MVDLAAMIKYAIRGVSREMLWGPAKRATMRERVLPLCRPLAQSGNQLILAMREAGLSYRRQDMLEDLRTPVETSFTGVVPHGEDQEAPSFLDEGARRFRYDVETWWRDPAGDWTDEAGVDWHQEGRSVWSEEPLSDEEIIAKARDEIDEDLARDPTYRSFLFVERGMPQAFTVGGVHVYEKSAFTGESFGW